MGSDRDTNVRLVSGRSVDLPGLAPVDITVKLRGANASAALQRIGRALPEGSRISSVFPEERDQDLSTIFVIEVSVYNGETLARVLERIEGVEYAHTSSTRRIL
jgi:hypothetical protein